MKMVIAIVTIILKIIMIIITDDNVSDVFVVTQFLTSRDVPSR